MEMRGKDTEEYPGQFQKIPAVFPQQQRKIPNESICVTVWKFQLKVCCGSASPLQLSRYVAHEVIVLGTTGFGDCLGGSTGC